MRHRVHGVKLGCEVVTPPRPSAALVILKCLNAQEIYNWPRAVPGHGG